MPLGREASDKPSTYLKGLGLKTRMDQGTKSLIPTLYMTVCITFFLNVSINTCVLTTEQMTYPGWLHLESPLRCPRRFSTWLIPSQTPKTHCGMILTAFILMEEKSLSGQ